MHEPIVAALTREIDCDTLYCLVYLSLSSFPRLGQQPTPILHSHISSTYLHINPISTPHSIDRLPSNIHPISIPLSRSSTQFPPTAPSQSYLSQLLVCKDSPSHTHMAYLLSSLPPSLSHTHTNTHTHQPSISLLSPRLCFSCFTVCLFPFNPSLPLIIPSPLPHPPFHFSLASSSSPPTHSVKSITYIDQLCCCY